MPTISMFRGIKIAMYYNDHTKKTDVLAEIGTGSGIISILVNYKEKPKRYRPRKS